MGDTRAARAKAKGWEREGGAMLGWIDAASGVLGVWDIMCECHDLYNEQWSREWKGVERWRGGVVLMAVRARGGAHHTQIDVVPLLEDVGSFRIPDR